MAEKNPQGNRLQRVIDTALLVIVAACLLLILVEMGTSVTAELQQGQAGTPLAPARTLPPTAVQPTPPPTAQPGTTPGSTSETPIPTWEPPAGGQG